MTVWKAHRELQAHRHPWEKPCLGNLIVVEDDLSDITTVECDLCGYEAGVPSLEIAETEKARW